MPTASWHRTSFTLAPESGAIGWTLISPRSPLGLPPARFVMLTLGYRANRVLRIVGS